ncbi:hypothetical protein ZOSMA_933G00010 [Zostera marina]|uniref:Peptidase M16 C-terminal domain-containing protein n=1 Tax=Zostera marina TaxID=29655 RepID=A0A0K9NIS5_ZOSMR|nr:hypothetical protein ZOSMA_933G00010 [Zostera marina]
MVFLEIANFRLLVELSQIFYNLHIKGWVIDLSAGEEDSSDDFSFFSVRIKLTDTGYAHVEDIVGLLFKYISLLQNSGIHEWIFDESANIMKIEATVLES